MADPTTWAMVGAGAGALFDKEDPLRGAALGGLGSWFGGPMLGQAVGGSATANALAAGISPASQQAAMLAAQTGEFGLPGLAATNSAAGYATGAGGGLFGSAKNFLGQEGPLGLGSRGDWLGAAGKVSGMGQPQQPQNAVMSTPFAQPQTPPTMFASLGPNADLLEKQGALFGRPINNLGRLPRV